MRIAIPLGLCSWSPLHRSAWWTYAAAVNIATEAIILALYLMIIYNLQVSILRRSAVLAILSTRILVIAAVAAQLATFHASYSAANPTQSLWLPTILNQVVLSLNVLTACLPYLRPLMESLESSVVRVDDAEADGEVSRYTDQPGSVCLSNASRSTVPHRNRSSMLS